MNSRSFQEDINVTPLVLNGNFVSIELQLANVRFFRESCDYRELVRTSSGTAISADQVVQGIHFPD